LIFAGRGRLIPALLIHLCGLRSVRRWLDLH
jgi:hypothetical protein